MSCLLALLPIVCDRSRTAPPLKVSFPVHTGILLDHLAERRQDLGGKRWVPLSFILNPTYFTRNDTFNPSLMVPSPAGIPLALVTDQYAGFI